MSFTASTLSMLYNKLTTYIFITIDRSVAGSAICLLRVAILRIAKVVIGGLEFILHMWTLNFHTSILELSLLNHSIRNRSCFSVGIAT